MIRQERINGIQKQMSECIAQAYERGFKDGMKEHERREKEREEILKAAEKEIERLEREAKASMWTYPLMFKEGDNNA